MAPSRNRVIVPACQATWAGGIHSLESIPGLHKRLKIWVRPRGVASSWSSKGYLPSGGVNLSSPILLCPSWTAWNTHFYLFILFECDWMPNGREIMCVSPASRKQILSGWVPVACYFCMQVAASCIQIVPEWPPVTCKLYLRGRQAQADYCQFYSCCMWLAAKWVQFACDRPPLRFNLNATGRQSHAIFACTSGQYSAMPPVFESTLPEQLIELKNEENIKNLNLRDILVYTS